MKAKTKAPEQTFEEVKYLRYLIDQEIPVRIRLSSNEEVTGIIDKKGKVFQEDTRDHQLDGAMRARTTGHAGADDRRRTSATAGRSATASAARPAIGKRRTREGQTCGD